MSEKTGCRNGTPFYQYIVTMYRSDEDAPDEYSVDLDTRHEAVGTKAVWQREFDPDRVEIEVDVLSCFMCGEPLADVVEVESAEEIDEDDHLLSVRGVNYAHKHLEGSA